MGRAIALELAERGAAIAVHHRASVADATALVREIEGRGGRAVGFAADLEDPVATLGLAREVEQATGGVTILVNSAANYLHTPWSSLDEHSWDLSLDVNLKAPFLLSLHLGRAMRLRGRGVIINITDAFGDRPVRGYLPYSVAKAGLVALTRGLAIELAPEVRVNAVAPGPVQLPEHTTPEAAAAIARATALGHLGTPGDVARAVRFLVEEATYSTGTVLTVDGGRTLR